MAEPYVYAHPRFCTTEPMNLLIMRGWNGYRYPDYVIGDVDGNLVFQVKKQVSVLHKKMILLDSSGSPVLAMRKKIMSMHDRWEVFRGGNTDEGNLLYTVKSSSMFGSDSLKVFMVHNDEEDKCDFGVTGNYMGEYVAYAGGSNIIVAKMKHIPHSSYPDIDMSGRDFFWMTVNPNVNYAFIASLVSLFDVTNRGDPPVTNEAQEVSHAAHTLVHVLHQLLH